MTVELSKDELKLIVAWADDEERTFGLFNIELELRGRLLAALKEMERRR